MNDICRIFMTAITATHACSAIQTGKNVTQPPIGNNLVLMQRMVTFTKCCVKKNYHRLRFNAYAKLPFTFLDCALENCKCRNRKRRACKRAGRNQSNLNGMQIRKDRGLEVINEGRCAFFFLGRLTSKTCPMMKDYVFCSSEP